MLEYNGDNIVLISGQNLNSFNIGEKWFIQHSLLQIDEILDGKSVTTPVLSLIHTENFRIQILNNQFVIFFEKTGNNTKTRDRVLQLIKTLIESNLLHPIIAIGINIHYSTESLPSTEFITEKMHFNSNNKLHNFLSGQKNKRFGSYTSMDYLDSRLRIDIKPHINVEENGESSETLNAGFNFSKNINDGVKNEELIGFFKNFDSFFKYSTEVVKVINEIT